MGTEVEFPAASGSSRAANNRDASVLRRPLSQEKDNDLGQFPAQFGTGVPLIRFHGFANQRGMIFSLALMIIVTCLTLAPLPVQSQQNPPTQGAELNHAAGHRMLSAVPGPDDIMARADGVQLTPKQKLILMRANFERSKIDATELAALARKLREELDKPDAEALSVEVINHLERIEKLAKKIRDETKGN